MKRLALIFCLFFVMFFVADIVSARWVDSPWVNPTDEDSIISLIKNDYSFILTSDQICDTFKLMLCVEYDTNKTFERYTCTIARIHSGIRREKRMVGNFTIYSDRVARYDPDSLYWILKNQKENIETWISKIDINLLRERRIAHREGWEGYAPGYVLFFDYLILPQTKQDSQNPNSEQQNQQGVVKTTPDGKKENMNIDLK